MAIFVNAPYKSSYIVVILFKQRIIYKWSDVIWPSGALDIKLYFSET